MQQVALKQVWPPQRQDDLGRLQRSTTKQSMVELACWGKACMRGMMLHYSSRQKMQPRTSCCVMWSRPPMSSRPTSISDGSITSDAMFCAKYSSRLAILSIHLKAGCRSKS